MLKKEALWTIVFGMLLLFNFASCKSDSGDGSGPFASGEFESKSNKAIFELYSSGGSKAAAEDTVSTLSGDLEDGDILVRLNGTYNETNGTYKVSAASSIIRYTINGSVLADGSHVATATIAVNTGGDIWETFTVPVTNKAVNVTATDYDIETVELPPGAEGLWYDKAATSNGGTGYLDFEKIVISPLNISSVQWSEIPSDIPSVGFVHFFHGATLTVLKSEQKTDVSGDYWDIVFASERYEDIPDLDDYRCAAVEDFFDKIHTTITKVDNIVDINGAGIRYWIGALSGYNRGYYFKGHSDDDFWKIEQFFSVNHLQSYLVSHGKSLSLQYMKQKLELKNGQMIGTAYDHGGDEVFEVASMSDIGTVLNPVTKRTFVRTVAEIDGE